MFQPLPRLGRARSWEALVGDGYGSSGKDKEEEKVDEREVDDRDEEDDPDPKDTAC